MFNTLTEECKYEIKNKTIEIFITEGLVDSYSNSDSDFDSADASIIMESNKNLKKVKITTALKILSKNLTDFLCTYCITYLFVLIFPKSA